MSSREAADLYVRVVETALRLGSDKAFDADILRLRAELARTEATITAAAALREQALAEKAKAHSDSEKAVLQKKVEELNTQIAKSAEEQKNLASQLAAASQLRQASAAADIARANSSRDASAEISQDPTKATPSATQR